MTSIALLVTHDYYPARPDRSEGDFAAAQLMLLAEACTPFGITLAPVFWQDDGNDWAAFAAVIPLMAWNYPKTPEVFLRRLDEIGRSGSALLNPLATLRANMDKGYLAELAGRGAPVPPTLAFDACEEEAVRDAFALFGCDEIIIKPRIGAGAWRQSRLKRDAPWPSPENLPDARALVQPFLPAVASEGELSLLYFGGRFSHAVMKTPKSGDYRTQGQHGAVEVGVSAPAEAMAAAAKILALSECAPHLYARVDLVRGPDGGWLLMELELIEPWLYLGQDGAGGRHGAAVFAQALAERLGTAG